MKLDELAARLDPLAFPARQRVLADTARSLAGSAELTALLAELHATPGIPRTWAVMMAVVVGDDTHLLRCLTAPDTAVAVTALHHCVRHDRHRDAVLAALPTAPSGWRHALYRALRATGSDWADALLPVVRARFGDHEAAAVLPACDAATVTALLPELDFAVPNLAALAHRHPGVVLAHLRRRLTEAGEVARGAVWARFGAALGHLARHDPTQLIDLLEHRGPLTGLPPGADHWLAPVTAADPDRVVAILADPRRRIRFRPGKGLRRALRRASDGSLTALVRSAIGDGDQVTALLRGLPPARRATVLDGALGERDIVRAGLPVALLDLLPWRARHAHARRLLATRPVADHPQTRLAVTARLPWAEAEPVLRAETARSTADERGRAYPLLIGAAAASRDPDTVTDLLASLTRLPNEQDPVRRAALQAIAAIPAWLFQPGDLPVLEKVATDAVEARDASWPTKQAVGTLAVALIRHGTLTTRPETVDCGLRMLELSGGHSYLLNLHHLDRDLPRGAEHAVYDALRPRITADAGVGRFHLLLSLAAGLGRRAWAMPDLQDQVGDATTARDDGVVRQAIDLWLAPPATRDSRVATVLHHDRSTITVGFVAKAVGLRRTDLLDLVFTEPLHGRFVRRGVRLVPMFHHSGHWLPRQIDRYAELLTDLATTPGKSVWERVPAVRILGRLPGIGADAVRPFLADGEVAVVEAALGALAWTDRPGEVLGELLGYADTDRARVAVYAATRAARWIAPAGLVTALRPVLANGKVTARKEAVRLVAQDRVPDVVGELAALWADPRLHRDVRRAIVSSVRWVLDDERVWSWLADATTAVQAVATGLTEAGPLTIAERHRARYGALVRAVAARPDADVALVGLAAWPAWSAWDRDGAPTLVAMVGDLAATATWRAAVDALITAGDLDAPHAVITRLSEVDEVVVPDRDLPARQRLRYFVRCLGARIDSSGESLRATADAVAATLGRDHRADALALAVAALPRSGEPLPALRRIAALADRPVLAWQAADLLAAWVATYDPGRSEWLPTTLGLTASGAEALLAVGIAEHAGAHAGWPRPWRDLVSALRGHPDPDVRERAMNVATAPE